MVTNAQSVGMAGILAVLPCLFSRGREVAFGAEVVGSSPTHCLRTGQGLLALIGRECIKRRQKRIVYADRYLSALARRLRTAARFRGGTY